MFEARRARRIIFNDDADQLYGYEVYPYGVVDDRSFLAARTTPVFDTQVDTYVWCVGNGCEPPWGGALGDKLLPCLGSADRATGLVVDACHAHGLEVWGSLRMNDIHDSIFAKNLGEANDPLKARHPEYLIAAEEVRSRPEELYERYHWTAFNFARPEVRSYRLDFIERNASRHDFDGYELDFTRFAWMFPLGEERAHAAEMTQLVRDARETLRRIGARRGRPYTFAVHVHDSLDTSRALGLDVDEWLAEGLVDVLVVGLGYLSWLVRFDQWLPLGRRCGVPVYPSMNTNAFISWGRDVFKDFAAWREAIRGAASSFWTEGGSGIYLFNLFCLEDKSLGGHGKEFTYAPLREVGEPAGMAKLTKLYAIQPVSESGFCQHGAEATPLPIALASIERKLPLRIGADAAAPGARFTVLCHATGGDGKARVWFRATHVLLPAPRRAGGVLATEIPAGVLRPGTNTLAVWDDRSLAKTAQPVIVQRIFVRAEHR